MGYRYLLIILLFVWVSGCGGTLKRGWTNFTTYYNTFYNANQYFEAGRKEARNQSIILDPVTPVRIHHRPAPAGSEAFEKAIIKCVMVLQEHPESKWADDALLLMGKSHYYLGDYIEAIKRLEQLNELGADNSLMQQAAIWKGRALLDHNNYEEGLAYLEPLIESYPREWDRVAKGELQTLVAEYHAMLGNWDEASAILTNALSNLTDRRLLGRTYFLHGQMLEREGRFGEALYAFKQVPSYFPGAEYTYWSNIKQADVARKRGNLEAALAIYQRLKRNDKYIDRRSQLTFKIAQILQDQDKVDEAEELYRALLYGEDPGSERSLQADIYYQMGKIYSDSYQNFTLATAYFDTSSSLRSQGGRMSDSTGVYRQYAKLKVSIAQADSLLWLGSLPPGKLDSVIAEIESEKRQQLLEEQQKRVDNSMRNEPVLQQEEGDSTQSALYGFLNHRNQNLLEQGKREFQILWGNRPLVDNWRRQQAINRSAINGNNNLPAETSEATRTGQVLSLDLGLDAIPRTDQERLELKKERLRTQYQLGNIFQLNLNKPDSARKYYYKVVSSELEDEVRPRAMYALYELFNARSESDSVQYWQNRIVDEFPGSEFARLVAAEGGPLTEIESDSTRLRDAYQRIQVSSDLSKGAQLRSLALNNRASGLAPDIHFKAIEAYIKKAQAYEQIAETLSVDAIEPDPSAKRPSDSQFPVDLLFREGRYRSVHWDSVRTVLAEHDRLFADSSSYQSQVASLQQELAISTEAVKQERSTCSEEGISIEVQPSMQQFMSTVNWPDDSTISSLSGEVVYEFVINKDGTIQSYSLVSPSTTLGIEEALEDAFEESLRIKLSPPGKQSIMLNCEIAFPIDL